MKARSFRWRCKRLRRGLGLKLRLSVALLIAGAFSLSRPKEGLPRIVAAFKTWLRWAREPVKTPFWIFYGRMKACRTCHLYEPRLGTCGSPVFGVKEDRGDGCFCQMTAKAAIPESDCWMWEVGVTGMGWPDHVRRLSGLRGESESAIGKGNDGNSTATIRRCSPCGRRVSG